MHTYYWLLKLKQFKILSIAGYNPPEGYVPTMINPMLQLDYNFDFDSLDGVNRFVVPYIACGDLRFTLL